MTTYWTVLLVTYLSGDFRGEASPVLFPDHAQCSAAIEPTFDLLTSDVQTVMVSCIETRRISRSAPPKPRPSNG